jgi:hypothetical protein
MKNLTRKGYDLATIYFSILRAIPHRWKRLIRGIGK